MSAARPPGFRPPGGLTPGLLLLLPRPPLPTRLFRESLLGVLLLFYTYGLRADSPLPHREDLGLFVALGACNAAVRQSAAALEWKD